MWCRVWWLVDNNFKKLESYFLYDNTFLDQTVCHSFKIYCNGVICIVSVVFLNIFKFNLHILKSVLLRHSNMQNTNVIAYSNIEYSMNRMCLCTSFVMNVYIYQPLCTSLASKSSPQMNAHLCWVICNLQLIK